MVKISVIVSKDDEIINESVKDIEIVDDLDNAQSDYVYFKNIHDKLDSNLLLEAYEKCIEDDLDYVVFNNTGFDETEEIGVYSFDEFDRDFFTTDLKLTSKLIKKSIIDRKQYSSQHRELFNCDIIISSKRFSFLKKPQNDFTYYIEDVDSAIDVINELFSKLRFYKMFNKFKPAMYNFKMDTFLKIYENAREDEKEDIYLKLKDDLTELIYSPRYVDFCEFSTLTNKIFFDNVVYSADYEEFLELMPNYYIKVEVTKLKGEIKEIEKENAKIRKETQKLNKMNRDIMNSRSWSITKPLRDIKRAR